MVRGPLRVVLGSDGGSAEGGLVLADQGAGYLGLREQRPVTQP